LILMIVIATSILTNGTVRDLRFSSFQGLIDNTQ